jgi:5-hydroxyisourate hydrolase-like protein (transthyretin family)
LTFLAFQGVRPPETQRPPAASIEGLVLQAGSGDPITKAQVTLTRDVTTLPTATPTTVPPLPTASIPPILTDARGKFVFPDLEPGAYRLTAARNGFVRENYGARYSGGPGTTINVAAGQTMKDIAFHLVQTATISGRLRTSQGEPGAGLSVQLLRVTYTVSGQRSFQTISSDRADDRGEYRLFWISPGRYYLAVTSASRSLTQILADGGIMILSDSTNTPQPTIYYPGTVDPSRASAIEVHAGRELPGMDITLPDQPVYRVRGRVVDVSTGQPPRTASVSLISRNTSVAALGSSHTTSYNAAAGTFELRDVVPGQYWIRAQASESTATATVPQSAVGRSVSEVLTTAISSRSAAQQSLDVTGDLDGVVLTLNPGVSISGTLTVEGAPLPATPAPRISLRSPSPAALSSSLQPINPDGTFTLTNVFPGEYRVFVTPLPPGYYIKQARNDQEDILNQPWVVGGSVRGALDVVLSSNAGQIDGTVTNSKLQTISAIQVVLIPDQNRDRSELFRTVVTNQDGQFRMVSVPPGDYRLYAWETLEPNSYYDPEVLTHYEPHSKPIKVLEGAKLTTELKLIPVQP